MSSTAHTLVNENGSSLASRSRIQLSTSVMPADPLFRSWRPHRVEWRASSASPAHRSCRGETPGSMVRAAQSPRVRGRPKRSSRAVRSLLRRMSQVEEKEAVKPFLLESEGCVLPEVRFGVGRVRAEAPNTAGADLRGLRLPMFTPECCEEIELRRAVWAADGMGRGGCSIRACAHRHAQSSTGEHRDGGRSESYARRSTLWTYVPHCGSEPTPEGEMYVILRAYNCEFRYSTQSRTRMHGGKNECG